MVRMRISLAIGCCLVSMAVHSDPPDPATVVVPTSNKGWLIEPGTVNKSLRSPSKISGTFTRVRGGVDEGDTGGACLTYQYDKSINCKSDDECNVRVTTNLGTTLPLLQGHGYCDVDHSIVATSPTGTCWYKPL